MSNEAENTAQNVALLTRAECADLLAKALTVPEDSKLILKDYTICKAAEAIGFLGEYYRLVLNYQVLDKHNNAIVCNSSSTQRLLFFIKTLPTESNEPLKEAIFQKESKLYQTLLKELQALTTTIWTAKVFYARSNLLVMEDVQQRGYVLSQQQTENLSDLEIKQILNSLAVLHAASIAYEQRTQTNIGSAYKQQLQEITVAPNIAWYTTGLQAIIAVIRKYYKDVCAYELTNRLAAVYDMVNPTTKYCNVLCHRDLWRGNIFYKQTALQAMDDSTCALFVDFQTCRYCAASVDIVFVLYMNLSRAMRQQHERTYMRWYYQKFCAQLECCNIAAAAHMTWQQLLSSYRELQLFGCVYKAIATTILQVPKHFVTDHYKHVERTQAVLDYMSENVHFRVQMLESTAEIVELLLL